MDSTCGHFQASLCSTNGAFPPGLLQFSADTVDHTFWIKAALITQQSYMQVHLIGSQHKYNSSSLALHCLPLDLVIWPSMSI